MRPDEFERQMRALERRRIKVDHDLPMKADYSKFIRGLIRRVEKETDKAEQG